MPEAAWDIFEPRPPGGGGAASASAPQPSDAAAAAHAALGGAGDGASCEPRSRADVRRELARLDGATARQLLAALEAGAAVRKKWVSKTKVVAVTPPPPAHEAPPPASLPPPPSALPPSPPPLPPLPSGRRTVRHVRVRVEGGDLVLRYYCRGAAARTLIRRDELAARVHRVTAPGGAWRPGATFLVATDRGVLALEPPDAAAAAAWGLGLNAGLAAVAVRRPQALLDARARSVPRAAAYTVVGE